DHKRGCQVTVMFLDHARVAVAQVSRHDEQGYAIHDRVRGPGVPQTMESDWWRDLGVLAGLAHRAQLFRFPPVAAIADGGNTFGMQSLPIVLKSTPRSSLIAEDEFASDAPSANLLEKLCALVGQGGVIDPFGSVTLARPHAERASIGIEIGRDKLCKLTVTPAGLQRRLHQQSEIRIAGIN